MAKKETKVIRFTKMEQKYLDLLKETKGPVQLGLLMNLHPDTYNSNVVAVHIRNLRKKIDGFYTIESQRGYGYELLEV